MKSGGKHSEETKRKIREANKRAAERRWADPEYRRKQVEAQSGENHWRFGKRVTPHGHEVETKLREIKRGAEKRDLAWELTDDEARALIVSECRYCGRESKPAEDRTTVQSTRGLNGIDRVDPSIGYVAGNVAPCCGRCNTAKWTDSHEDFLAWVRLVHSRLART